MCFYETNSIFISRTIEIYAKTLTVSESAFKLKIMSAWILFIIFLMSAVICKRRFLHENEIVQYLQNYKYKEVNHGRFRKTKQASTNVIKNNYHKTAHTFFTGCSIFSYFFTFNLTCYNFRTALTKSVKLHCLEIAF